MYATEAQVRAVHKNVEVGDDIAIYMETANTVIEDHLGALGYTEGKLALIEAWLSAHFYAVSNKETSMETVGSASEQFQYKLGVYLANTMYGQQAMALDSSGTLARLNKRFEKGNTNKASIAYLGSERESA